MLTNQALILPEVSYKGFACRLLTFNYIIYQSIAI